MQSAKFKWKEPNKNGLQSRSAPSKKERRPMKRSGKSRRKRKNSEEHVRSTGSKSWLR